jgi:hypothetical protein
MRFQTIDECTVNVYGKGFKARITYESGIRDISIVYNETYWRDYELKQQIYESRKERV